MAKENKLKVGAVPVRLGVMPPLTGLVELYGQEISWAATIACQEINQQGGVLGRPLELVIEDDGSMPEMAVPAARRLIDEHGCVAIIGNLLSNSRIAVADHVSLPKQIPYLNFSFYEGSIFNRYFFNFAALPNQQIDKMIPYMANHFGPKMFFAGNNYEWPRGSIDAAKRSLTAYGGEILGEEYFEIGTNDFSELMERVAKSGADVFVPYAAGSDQINLLNQFTETGLKGRMAVVMGHYDEAMVASLLPEVREGFYSSNTYFMNIQNEANQDYLRQLASLPEVTGIWPEGNGVMTNFGEGTYLCVHAFAKAANLAGSLDAEKLVETLETLSVVSPQGEVRMDAATHHATVNTYLSRCELDGRFTIVENFGQTAPVIPQRYQRTARASQYLPEVSKVNDDDWQELAILPYPLPDETELANPLLSRLLKIKVDSSVSRGLLKVLREHCDELEGIVKSASEQFLEVPTRLSDATTQCLLISPVMHGDDCSYIVVSGNRQADILNKESIGSVFDGEDILQEFTSTSERILGVADVGIIAIDEQGTIIQVNSNACGLFGFSRNELTGMSVNLLLPPHLREAHKANIAGFISAPRLTRLMTDRAEITCYKKDGSFFPAEASISKLKTKDGWVMVATLRDITERKKSEQELLWHATHDPLTHLPNRMLMNDRLENALKRSVRAGKAVALMFIDVDEFKLINDTYGHEIGDKLLTVIAEELTSLVRPGDTVARFGGDEFIVMCDQINDIDVVTSIADRISARLKKPIRIEKNEFYSTVSIGIALGFGVIHTAENLFKNAGAAMYSVKSKGKDGWAFFSDDIGDNSKRQLQLANGLRTAISQNELYPVIQPIVDAATGLIVGGEILLRWEHKGELISPVAFIPIAEMNGTIRPIGEWVFRQTCELLRSFKPDISEELMPSLSVNLSARQLAEDSVVDRFLNIIQETGVDAHRITLEITETVLMNDVEHTIDMLNMLGKAGFNVAVDDFGTGYSSLSQLKRLPVDTLKVDKIFVDDIDDLSDTFSITSAIISMAHSLGLKVTAEGVETKQQLNTLQNLGCDKIQGYYFFKPLPLDEFKMLYRQQNPGAEMAS